jgi:redox-sensitive bicupin YhaK (pirin superfamily)
MKKTVYRADERGFANHGWLKSYHMFSFANYYDEARMSFGSLRVLNDDFVKPGMGFGTHPHDNMEIISIPLEGILAHKDSQGNECTLREGDLQIMSAGTGLTHSEYNFSGEHTLNFLQLWVFPHTFNTEPRYEQRSFTFPRNELVLIISPDRKHGSLPINQDAYFYLGRFSKDSTLPYRRSSGNNGLFIFIIEGKLSLDYESLHRRDAIGLVDMDEIRLNFKEDSHILLIDIPMHK